MSSFNPAKCLSKINVIISDNDEKIIGLMADILKKLGFGGIFSAQDGFAAVDVLQKRKVDLIITDWELTPLAGATSDLIIKPDQWDTTPPENGASFVQFVRGSKQSPVPYVPIIMLTGNAVQHNVEYARDAGVDAILVKPVSAVALCKRIVKIVNHPRFFISTDTYKGPCRRRRSMPIIGEQLNRRKFIAEEIKRPTL